MPGPHEKMNRRQFMQKSLYSVSAVGAVSAMAKNQSDHESKIRNYQPEMRYRRLGSSDIYLSVISLGGLIVEEAVHQYAIDHGVNLVHISKSYKGGASIRSLGKVLKNKRDKVYIAVKDNFNDIDEILTLLGTDHIDFLMFNRHTPDEAAEESIWEQAETLLEAGKVRYLAGITIHNHIKETVNTALDKNFSLLMTVLNPPNLDLLQPELKKAYHNGTGVIAMKTMKGVENDLQRNYLLKVLSHPEITSVVKGIGSFELFDQYLNAIQETYSYQQTFESKLLYSVRNDCLMCGACEKACPQHIHISTVLRCIDYYSRQLNDESHARATFQEMAPARRFYSNCDDCKMCERVCPQKINITSKLWQATQSFESVVV
jgi:predicted aldo/keto reductase-like oxidoreductase